MSACVEESLPDADRHHPDPLSGGHAKWRRLEDDGKAPGSGEPYVTKFDASKPLVQIAPMLHVTDRHFRAFMRTLTHRAELWSEMVVDSTVKHTDDLEFHLGHSEIERPLVCQLGGSDPASLAEASRVVEEWNYDKINLNVGCPSKRVVKSGCFGAQLMYDPLLVKNICAAMRGAVNVPVSVKTRVAVDDFDSDEWMEDWLKQVSASGVDDFILHARPAWISKRSLSPAQNRSIPPLNYDRVFTLCKRLPDLHFSINGGVQSLDEVEELLRVPHSVRGNTSALEGVMVGRAATDRPAFLGDVDRRIYGCKSNPASAETRRTVLEAYMDYCAGASKALSDKAKTTKHAFPFLRPTVGLFHSTRASKLFRQSLDCAIRERAASETPSEILSRVIAIVDNSKVAGVLDQPLAETSPPNDENSIDQVES